MVNNRLDMLSFKVDVEQSVRHQAWERKRPNADVIANQSPGNTRSLLQKCAELKNDIENATACSRLNSGMEMNYFRVYAPLEKRGEAGRNTCTFPPYCVTVIVRRGMQ